MNNFIHYNPNTNKLITGKRIVHDSNFISLGDEKIAEAFTSVSPEERKKLWLALHSTTYSFNFNMLNSKIRHKLKRLGLYQLCDREISRGEKLLKKIKNKNYE